MKVTCKKSVWCLLAAALILALVGFGAVRSLAMPRKPVVGPSVDADEGASRVQAVERHSARAKSPRTPPGAVDRNSPRALASQPSRGASRSTAMVNAPTVLKAGRTVTRKSRPAATDERSRLVGLDTNVGLSSMLVGQNQDAGSATMADETLLYGNVSLLSGQLPIAKPIVVNPYDDEASRMRARGELIGPYRPQRLGAVASGDSCSFDVDCDDCNPCTLDICEIEGGGVPGSGKCSNAPIADGLVGDCSDGLFCNKVETCQNGVCETPGNGTVGGPDCEAGEVCDEFEDECAVACTSDASCDDSIHCNGVELCCLGGTLTGGASCPVDGVCHPAANPCGAGADCSELVCGGDANPSGRPCEVDGDCPAGETCDFPGPGCFRGRCCTGEDNQSCSNEKKLADCTGDWYATDPGNAIDDTGICSVPGHQCPLCGGGIGPQGDFDFDEITLASDSVCKNDQGKGVFRLGDDFQMVGHPAAAADGEGFVELQGMRWVGGVEFRIPFAERVVFEFYDDDLNFIEDIFFVSGVGNAVRTLIFNPPLDLPTKGYVAAGVANKFSPEGAVRWLSTTGGWDVGVNDPDVLWKNDGPVSPSATSTAGHGFDFGTDGLPSSGRLAFELLGVTPQADPVGGCCDLETGACLDNLTNWICKTGACSDNEAPCVDSADCNQGATCKRRTFLGTGIACAICDTTSGDRSFQPCRTCDDKSSCDSDADCVGHGGIEKCEPNNSFCAGGAGADPGAQCVAQATCETGGCCDDNTGECTEGLTDTECALAGATTFLDFGTDCVPNCCAQPASVDTGFSGGDNCEDVFVHDITVPGLSETRCNATGIECNTSADCGGDPCVPAQVVITITGDNSTATSTEEFRDSCLLQQFNPNIEDFDPGWWEGIQTDDCFQWRIDNCCTDPTHIPQYRVIAEGCPCGDFIFSNDQADGAPFCEDDNQWSEYGPLPPGTYYFPTFSALSGTHGEYQLHFTIEACPAAACCYLACTRQDPDFCDDKTPCNVGVCVESTCRELCSGPDAECEPDACEARCDVMNQLDCDALDGVFQGPPNKFPATVACIQNQPGCDRFLQQGCGTCQLGSCCAGPGECRDLDPSGVFTKDQCDDRGQPFRPGLKCHGGFCDLQPIKSCAEDEDCALGPCIGDPDQLAQPSPCPVCETDNEESCRFSPLDNPAFFGGFIFNIDRGNNLRIADDFIPTGTTIREVCFDPAFFNPNTGDECVDHCESAVGVGFPDDQWQVTIYDTDPITGLPGNALGVGTQTVNVEAKLGLGGGFRVCVYAVTLPEAVTVTPGECHWLEISGAGPGGEAEECNAYWVNTETGNAFALQDDNGVYGINDAVEFDFAFCVDSGIDNTGPDCGPVEGACCRCPASEGGPARCDDGEFAECVALEGRFNFDVDTCPGTPGDLCPSSAGPEDTCANRLVLNTAGDDQFTITADNFCATPDGPSPVFVVESAQPVLFEDDLWYEYKATCSGELTISTCADNNDFDAVLAVYHDPGNPTACPCPGDAGFIQLGPGSDFNVDECPINLDAFLRLDVIAGNCYTVRLGGQDSQGITDVNLSCGVSDCNGNGIPDDQDLANCADDPDCSDCNNNNIPDACDIAAQTSQDCQWNSPEPINGIPDECDIEDCVVAATTVGTSCDDCDNDDIPDGCVPPTSCEFITETGVVDSDKENVTIAPDPGVTAAAGAVTVTVIVDATFNNLRVLDGAQLLVTGGDLTVTEGILVDVRPGAISGTTLFVGADDSVTTTRLVAKRGGVIEVEGGAAINISGAFILDRDGIYREKVGAVDSSTASLTADSITIHRGDGEFPGGNMTLNDFMSVTTGEFLLDGKGTIGTTAVASARGGRTPPIVRSKNSSIIAVEGDFVVLGAAEITIGFAGAFGANTASGPGVPELVLGGDFVNQSRFPSLFDWSNGKLTLDGSLGGAEPHIQTFEVGGLDLDDTVEGFSTDQDTLFETAPHMNFSMGTVEIVADTSVTFVNEFANTTGTDACDEALYVNNMILRSGSTITLDNARVYYNNLTQEANVTVETSGCGALVSIIVLDPLEAADDGLNGAYNRVGDFKMPTSAVAGGQEVSIRVTLNRMYIDSDEDASQCPPRQGLPNLQAFEGQVRYLGEPAAFTNNDLSADKWVGAKLQCTPLVRDWSASALATLLGGGVNTDTIYYYGAEVVPCSIHAVQQATQSCVDSANEDCFSDPLEVRTAPWGDIWLPLDNLNFTDIGKEVDSFKSIPFVPGDPPSGAPNKWRSMLRENEGAPDSAINFTDIGKTVDAFKTIAYSEDGPTDCP